MSVAGSSSDLLGWPFGAVPGLKEDGDAVSDKYYNQCYRRRHVARGEHLKEWRLVSQGENLIQHQGRKD